MLRYRPNLVACTPDWYRSSCDICLRAFAAAECRTTWSIPLRKRKFQACRRCIPWLQAKRSLAAAAREAAWESGQTAFADKWIADDENGLRLRKKTSALPLESALLPDIDV